MAAHSLLPRPRVSWPWLPRERQGGAPGAGRPPLSWAWLPRERQAALADRVQPPQDGRVAPLTGACDRAAAREREAPVDPAARQPALVATVFGEAQRPLQRTGQPQLHRAVP